MTTLQQLISEYGASAVVVAHAGNGGAFSETGEMVRWKDYQEYGNVEMTELAVPHVSEEGDECTHASDWIIEGTGDNPFRIRFYF